MTAISLMAAGYWFFRNKEGWEARTKSLLRDNTATVIVFGLAMAWFLYKVTQWGEADFGKYKNIAFAVFAAAGVGCWFLARDFLIVRGAAGIFLLTAGVLLKSAYMQYDIPQRLFLVSFVYVGILLSLYLGAVPYRLRDFFEWLYQRQSRVKTLGIVLGAYGLLLLGVSLSY